MGGGLGTCASCLDLIVLLGMSAGGDVVLTRSGDTKPNVCWSVMGVKNRKKKSDFYVKSIHIELIWKLID